MSPAIGLVVDDDEQVRRFFAEVLRRHGMHVVEASSALQALALAQTVRPSFVVTDIQMPGLNGVELCRRMRDDAATADVVLVVVSGAGLDQFEAAVAAGCDVVLPKPCPPALLTETVQRLLNITKKRPESFIEAAVLKERVTAIEQRIHDMRSDLRDALGLIDKLRATCLGTEAKLRLAEREHAVLIAEAEGF
jgi:CheY-like chemotaxis protein